tara:strand:- start:554 stop:988 length:435 start_codon:yes stop_codon:yes gene_type:complete
MKVKRTHPDAIIPAQGTPTDSGYDVVAIDDGVWSKDHRYIEYDTGIAIELPIGYHLKISARSSVSKYDLILCNGEGLIDNSYRNSIRFRFKYVSPVYGDSLKIYKKGDRIGQLKIEQTIYGDIEEVEELSDTDRGLGGFGSTGK